MTKPAPFVAACVQLTSGRSVVRNIDHALPLIEEAVAAGAALVQTPEMSSLVERSRERLMAEVGPEELDPMLAAFRDAARRLKIWLHIGSLSLKVGEKIANRAFVIDPAGDIIARYDKIHLFDADLPSGERWRESDTYTGGGEAVVAATPWGGLGLSICYDVRFPYLYRAEAEAGASMLTAPACFTRQTGEAHWVVLQRARAIENGAFMLSAAQAGTHEDGRETFGHSIIVDPWGRVLAEAGDKPGVILASIDPGLVADARGRIPTLQHTRSFRVSAGQGVTDPSRLAAE